MVEDDCQSEIDLAEKAKEICLGLILVTKHLQSLADVIWNRFRLIIRVGGREYPGDGALNSLQLMSFIQWTESCHSN